MAGKLRIPGLCALVLFAAALRLSAQDNAAGAADSAEAGGVESEAADDFAGFSRGSIPEELLRPRRGEAPRYPVDTVIGALGQGEAPPEAWLFARRVLAALVAGNRDAPALSAMNSVLLEGFFSTLETISPRSGRMGSGREEPDGAVSFLVRFIGREQGIVGELFVRRADEGTAGGAGSGWIFEDLVLEEARDRETENRDTNHRFDFSPYERFF
jgi:hypothetical protein